MQKASNRISCLTFHLAFHSTFHPTFYQIFHRIVHLTFHLIFRQAFQRRAHRILRQTSHSAVAQRRCLSDEKKYVSRKKSAIAMAGAQ